MMSEDILKKLLYRIQPQLECKAGELAIDDMFRPRPGRTLERDAIAGYPLAARVVKDIVSKNPTISADHIKQLFELEQTSYSWQL